MPSKVRISEFMEKLLHEVPNLSFKDLVRIRHCGQKSPISANSNIHNVESSYQSTRRALRLGHVVPINHDTEKLANVTSEVLKRFTKQGRLVARSKPTINKRLTVIRMLAESIKLTGRRPGGRTRSVSGLQERGLWPEFLHPQDMREVNALISDMEAAGTMPEHEFIALFQATLQKFETFTKAYGYRPSEVDWCKLLAEPGLPTATHQELGEQRANGEADKRKQPLNGLSMMISQMRSKGIQKLELCDDGTIKLTKRVVTTTTETLVMNDDRSFSLGGEGE
jgi:hypothetical protein